MNFMKTLGFQRSNQAKQSSIRQARRLSIEPLEERQMLSVTQQPNDEQPTYYVNNAETAIPASVTEYADSADVGQFQTFDMGINAVENSWKGGTSGEWNDTANWSLGHIPTAGEMATIPVGTTITVSANTTIWNLECPGNLNVTAGTLTMRGTVRITGELTASSGVTLRAEGVDADVVASGAVTVDNTNLYATGGAKFVLPGLTSYQKTGGYDYYLQATGANSILDLSNLVSLPHSAGYTLQIQALSGGKTLLPKLTKTDSNTISFTSTGINSELDLSGILQTKNTNVSATSGGKILTSSWNIMNGGTLTVDATSQITNLDKLKELSGVTVTLTADTPIPTAQWTKFASGTLTVEGFTPNFENLANIDNTNIYVKSGAIARLPKVTSYQKTGGYDYYLQATGVNSVLDLSNLVSLPHSAEYTLHIQALSDGKILLPKLTETSSNAIRFEASGNNSELDLSALIQTQNTSITVSDNATLIIPNFQLATSTDITISDADVDFPKLTQISNSTLTITGCIPDLSALKSIVNSNVYAKDGASLRFSALTSYSNTGTAVYVLEASGDQGRYSFSVMSPCVNPAPDSENVIFSEMIRRYS